jgi:hypothetical protein
MDKLALTCRVLYDQRVLDQRKEIEMLKMKLFFRDYSVENLKYAMYMLNCQNTFCKCSGCTRAGRMHYSFEDEEATCTFCPWFDNVLHERGFIVLRTDERDEQLTFGPYDEKRDKTHFDFNKVFSFSDKDCHLLENYDHEDLDKRWERIRIGKRLWNAESINDHWIKQFRRLFGPPKEGRISSPPTPPLSPRVVPTPSPRPVTIAINQGLELQALRDQLATQAAETQALKDQLAIQAAEIKELKDQLQSGC